MERKYIAFISYRHKELDMAVAKKTHALIERYRVPGRMRNGGDKRLGIAFRDQEELPVSGNLSEDICEALDHSEFLIVVCTPDTPQSPWVNREIEYFVAHHDRQHVLAILAAGEPDQAFPYALTHTGEETEAIVEPLAADVRADSVRGSLKKLDKESIRLFAAILGCPYDALARREQQRRQKRVTAIMAAVMAALVGYMSVLLYINQVIDGKNRELEQKNQTLLEQKRELQRTESSFLTSKAAAALEGGETLAAIQYAAAALPRGEDDRPYYAPAESALMEAMRIFKSGDKFAVADEMAIDLTSPAAWIGATADGAAVLVLDEYNVLVSYNADTGDVNWRLVLKTLLYEEPFISMNNPAYVRLDEARGRIYLLYEEQIIALDAATGACLWNNASASFQQFSLAPDGKTMICIAENATKTSMVFELELVRIDADTGRELRRETFERVFDHGTPYRKSWKMQAESGNTVFSEDGSRFAGVLYESRGETWASAETWVNYYLADLENGGVRIAYSEINEGFSIVLWMGLFREDGADVLTVVKQSPEDNRWLKIQRISLTEGTLLSEEEAKPQNEQSTLYVAERNAVLDWRNHEVLVSAGDQLYLIDGLAGTVVDWVGMKAAVVNLFRLDDQYFGYILANGLYAVGWRISSGFYDSQLWQAARTLGEDLTIACPGNGGFFQVEREDGQFKAFWTGDRKDGYGYIALIENASPRTLILSQTLVVEKEISRMEVTLEEGNEGFYLHSLLGGFPMLVSGDGTIWLAESGYANEYRYILYHYDPSSDTLLGTYPYSGDYANALFPVEETGQLILINSNGIWRYQPDAGEAEQLRDTKKVVVYEGEMEGETYHFWATRSKQKLLRREADGRVIAADCDGEQITLWLDGAYWQTVSLPEGIRWEAVNGLGLDSVFEAGENGYILVSDYGERGEEHRLEDFLLYNLRDGTWTRIEDAAHGGSDRRFILGETSGRFAVYEQDVFLNVYDPAAGGAPMMIRTGITADSVADARFICGDQYLAVCSQDGRLEIYDAAQGASVFTDAFSKGVSSLGRLVAQMDSLNRRLYILAPYNQVCLCIDAASWTKLAEISNAVGMDGARDLLYVYNYSDGLMGWKIPTMEALVENALSLK